MSDVVPSFGFLSVSFASHVCLEAGILSAARGRFNMNPLGGLHVLFLQCLSAAAVYFPGTSYWALIRFRRMTCAGYFGSASATPGWQHPHAKCCLTYVLSCEFHPGSNSGSASCSQPLERLGCVADSP